MKFLFLIDNLSAPYYQRKGLANALKYAGHDAYLWRPEEKPAFDVFAEYSPDAFFGTTYGLSSAIMKNVLARPHLKVALFASALGDVLKDVDTTKYPIVVAGDEEKRKVEQLHKAGLVSFVWIHHHPNRAPYTVGGWTRELGVSAYGSCKAADVLTYFGGERKAEYECSVGFIGGRWPYKSKNLDKYILPLCRLPDLNVKIFSNSGNWPVPQHLGFLQEYNAKHLFASATICPNVYEPHSLEVPNQYDVVERPWKTLAGGGFWLDCGYVDTIHKDCFPGLTVPYAKTPEKFIEKVRYYIKNPDEREKVRQPLQKYVLEQATYFHRAAEMLGWFGLPSESEVVMSAYRKWRAENLA